MNLNPIRAISPILRLARGRSLDEEDRALLLRLGLAAIYFAIVVPLGLLARLKRPADAFRNRQGGWREIDESTADVDAYNRQL